MQSAKPTSRLSDHRQVVFLRLVWGWCLSQQGNTIHTADSKQQRATGNITTIITIIRIITINIIRVTTITIINIIIIVTITIIINTAN